VEAGSTTRAIVSLIDLLPTIIEAAGGKGPEGIDGRSFMPVLLGEADRHRDRTFAAHTGDGKMNRSPMRCVRTGRFKYILNLAPENQYETHISAGAGVDGRTYWDSWRRLAERDARAKAVVERYHRRPAEELYDLENDPHEQWNLVGEPAHAQTLAALRESLKRWRVEQGEDLAKVPMPEDARKGEVPYAR
jgi:uncharacterized sulfatase